MIGDTVKWQGEVVSIRGRIGRETCEQKTAIPPLVSAKRTVSVIIKLHRAGGLNAEHFYGIGRSVKVTIGRLNLGTRRPDEKGSLR